MATILFDFDSTLISVESLDTILSAHLEARGQRLELERIGRWGMEGRLPFRDSLRARLALARPTREEVLAFGQRAWNLRTRGMAPVIEELVLKGHAVWIVSGAPREAVLPLASRLGIPGERVLAIELRWDEAGALVGLAEENPILEGKWRALEPICREWERPRIAVGDGVTDWEVVAHGCADLFIAYTEHARRAAVLERCSMSASSASELHRLLEELC
jgi:HAD superfamily phosphoserine phosphatase-like hydrolase